ncbi:MAG: dihydropteroate synthase [Acidobacteria bacterium]|nr:MAG: dihydropteroate synthase [Acidobacteriota bacterium]
MIPATTTPADPVPRPSGLGALWPRRLPVIMGILNCTPDSFSDGGRFKSTAEAVAHGVQMVHNGADIIDIGGESTRPGAQPVSAGTEMDRVVPVIRDLKRRMPHTLVSVDTCKTQVAKAALDAGADLVNDITAGADARMLETVASFGAGIILMHMRGQPRTMQENTTYSNVTDEVQAFLSLRAHQALEAGLPRNQVWLDPGIGFGKDDQANVRLLADVPDLATLGHAIVLGVSRKSMIGRLTRAKVEDRLPGSLAALTPAIAIPQSVVRVHDPHATLQFLEVLITLEEARR